MLIDKIRCTYTYLQQEIECADLLLKRIDDSRKQLWTGIRSGIICNDPLKEIDKTINSLIKCAEQIKEYNEEMENEFMQRVAEEQIRMQGFR